MLLCKLDVLLSPIPPQPGRVFIRRYKWTGTQRLWENKGKVFKQIVAGVGNEDVLRVEDKAETEAVGKIAGAPS